MRSQKFTHNIPIQVEDTKLLARHCERSKAIQCGREMDCFAALAMTNLKFSGLNQIEYKTPQPHFYIFPPAHFSSISLKE
jgi:hypothetical protein